MDGGGFMKIGDHDAITNFPRIYKCMGETITINRDANWSSATGSGVVFEKLAEQLSNIPGIDAKIAISSVGAVDGIHFTVDTDIIKDFKFTKPGPNPESVDSIRLKIIDSENILVVSGFVGGQYSERILDKSGNFVTSNGYDTKLPISRFQV